jgi:signal transduction histidine kinase/ligand-binding sensor domain-containing protein
MNESRALVRREVCKLGLSIQVLPRSRLLPCLLMLLAAANCFSSTNFETPTYTFHTWEAQDGLPQSTVTAVIQTQDGYLWVGSYGGLARFDGVAFTTFDDNNTPELRSSRVTCLYESEDRSLWIGHESGEITRYRAGRFESVEVRAQWPRRKIYEISEDAAGDIWLFSEEGLLARLRDGLVLAPESGKAPKLMVLVRSEKGTVWVSREGRISLLENGRLTPLPFREGGTNQGILGMGASRDGGLWVNADSRLRKWKGGRWVQDVTPEKWTDRPFVKLIESKNGVLAAGTAGGGLFLIFPEQTNCLQFSRATGFSADWVISLREDREGQFWAGTGGGGLTAVRSGNVRTLTPPGGWKGRAVLSVTASRDGALWVGTEGAGIFRHQDGNWSRFFEMSQIRNPYVWSIAEDNQGRIWAGTWGGGLWLWDGKNSFNRGAGLDSITSPTPAILCSSNGGMWIGTGAGLLRYENGKPQWATSGPELADVRTVRENNNGSVWFGMYGGGLGCLENGKVTRYRKADGLSSDFVESLKLDADGTLWIGTFGGGINRLKNGRISVINRSRGLANNIICDMQEDDLGHFWISSHAGIMRISRAELNLCADGQLEKVQCLSYGMSDGLPTLECSSGLQPASCKTADGHLWFPTSKGLVGVDPHNVTTNRLAPPVLIEQVLVDDRLIAGSEPTSQPIEIAPGRRRFEFRYTGLSFVAPEKVYFRHRLEGSDKTWIEAGTKRSVNYNYIPPGSYKFCVIACNNDGVWNETGAAVAFVVLPYFWQTLWFRFLGAGGLVAASGAVVWLATRRRMKRKLEQIERQRAIEQERARIANDIHDDLGSQLTRITMLSESARGELDDPVQLTADIGHIYDTAREVTRAMDEIVWAVNPKHDRLDSLVSYLEKFGLDFLDVAGIRCRLEMPSEFPEWRLTSEVRHGVFLAYKEALNNVVKHAAASEVRIRFSFGESSFELVVEDNGRGFIPDALTAEAATDRDRFASGNGLENMIRRLLEIGGRCLVTSVPKQGTKVTFTVSIPAGTP